MSGLQGHTPGPLADVLRMLAGNVDNGTWNSADVPGFVGYCASRMTEAAAALDAKGARIAELEGLVSELAYRATPLRELVAKARALTPTPKARETEGGGA